MNLLRIIGTGLLVMAGIGAASGTGAVEAQTTARETAGKGTQQLAILDTDIGDDIDDAFALALLLHSPEVKLLGITTTFGDTELRARLTERYLAAVHLSGIPVASGRQTDHHNGFSQAAYARQQPDHSYPEAAIFLLDQIKAHPGQITLIAIGPLVNVQDAIARDPDTFRKLKRVVMMGGSVYRGYGDNRPPEPEWNIVCDPAGAVALLASGVPVYMMPLDSTQIHLEEAQREKIFGFGSPLTDQLTLLYHQWKDNADNRSATPTLFDPVAVAYAVHPELCPMKALRLQVDEKGFTRPVDGEPNANVCVKSDEAGFLDLLLGRVAGAGR